MDGQRGSRSEERVTMKTRFPIDFMDSRYEHGVVDNVLVQAQSQGTLPKGLLKRENGAPTPSQKALSPKDLASERDKTLARRLRRIILEMRS